MNLPYELIGQATVALVGAILLELVAYGLYRVVRRRREDSPNVRLFCPDGPSTLDGDEDPVLVGTEDSEPAFRDDEVAYYECECGEYHGFLWGPPAPVYVADASEEQVAEHSLLSGGERVSKGRRRSA